MTHYYDEKQGHFKETMIKIEVQGVLKEFHSGSGVFSKDHLDNGSALLINAAQIKENQEVLDLGCGIGVVGICLKMLNPTIHLTLSDVNETAVALAAKNCHLHNIKGTEIKSNLFENIKKEFDTIVTNPPYVAGRKVCYQFIEESYKHLKKGGTLQLVARHQKGGKMLEKHMEDVFGNVETLKKGSGFRVYMSKR